MELRLLHAWMSRGVNSPALVATSTWRRIWLVDLPELALKHDCLLYSFFALSATQLSGAHPTDHELTVARYKYWTMALAEQRRLMTEGGYPAHVDIEAVTFTAMIIAWNAFAMLRDRDIEPYAPPVEWFDVSLGCWKICPFQEDIPEGTLLRNVVDMTQPIWKDGKTD